MGRNLGDMVPPSGAVSITPNDSADLSNPVLALNVAAAGAVALVTAGGDSVTVYIAAGIVFPCHCKKVLATGTTATGIVGLF